MRKREDNYHDIETVFYPVELRDILEILPNKEAHSEFMVTGIPIGDINSNLCYKAYHLLKKDYPSLPHIKLHLHKAIPAGAGLGGGSSDAAFTLSLLAENFLDAAAPEQLKGYALQLGSDCPFFLYNAPCFATGRGEQLTRVDINLSSYRLLLVNPGITIDTSWAFSKVKPSVPALSVRNIIAKPVQSWKQELVNDFEIPVFEAYPEVKEIKEKLYAGGAVYASLSGSGSTVYGIFEKDLLTDIEFPSHYFSRVLNLK